MVTVTVHQSRDCNKGFPPENLNDFIAWTREQRELIPESLRRSAVICFESVDDYGDIETEVTIKYARLETDEEYDTRVAREYGVVQKLEELDRQHYETLRKKFGDL